MSQTVRPATDPDPRSATPNAAAMAKAKDPLGPGRITWVGVVLSAGVVAIGVIGVHDALASANLIHGNSVIETSVKHLQGLQPQWWAVPVGIAAAVLGLWLLSVSLRPRPRTAVPLQSQTGVFLRRRDVRVLAERAADEIDGVLSTRVAASRRLAAVNVTVTGNDGRIADEVTTAVQERLAALERPPRIKVSLKPGGAP